MSEKDGLKMAKIEDAFKQDGAVYKAAGLRLDRRNDMLNPDEISDFIAADARVKYSTVRAANAAERSADTLSDLTAKINQLTESLENERELRQTADKRVERIAIITLIANWSAVILAIISIALSIFLNIG